MTDNRRTFAAGVVGVLVLILLNVFIVQKERLWASGEPLLLELAPSDPRSLLQGDYMALRYRLPDWLARDSTLARNGRLVVQVDARHVGTIQRLHRPGEALAADERLLRYRRRGGAVHLGAEAFFFQEGHAEVYEQARYGELRVDDEGNSLLVGLRDEDLNVLEPKDGS